jgi:arginine/serine-rich splicing factor 16
MTKWRGDELTMIDRFDARSHLDYLVEYKDPNGETLDEFEPKDNEERMLNYERYRSLVQNEAVGLTEVQSLKQIEFEEKYGNSLPPMTASSSASSSNENNKKSKEPKAQIGFIYEDSNNTSSTKSQLKNNLDNNKKSLSPPPPQSQPQVVSDEENEEDLDLALDINKLTSEHKVIINKCATNYGMQYGDYIRMLILDNEEKESIIRNKLLEAEKSQYSGRKSRRERRVAKEKRLRERGSLSPLSYIVKSEVAPPPINDKSSDDDDDDYHKKKRHRSKSGSPASNSKNKILFITSFGTAAAAHDDPQDLGETNAEMALRQSKINQTAFKANLFKNKKSSMSPRSRSNSPPSPGKDQVKVAAASTLFRHGDRSNLSNRSRQRNENSETSDSDNSSDEEKALRNYLKRKENRKHNYDDNKGDVSSENLLSNKNGKLKDNENANYKNININNDNNNNNNDNRFLSSKNSNLNKVDSNIHSKVISLSRRIQSLSREIKKENAKANKQNIKARSKG